jgi:hypothetical protein
MKYYTQIFVFFNEWKKIFHVQENKSNVNINLWFNHEKYKNITLSINKKELIREIQEKTFRTLLRIFSLNDDIRILIWRTRRTGRTGKIIERRIDKKNRQKEYCSRFQAFFLSF